MNISTDLRLFPSPLLIAAVIDPALLLAFTHLRLLRAHPRHAHRWPHQLGCGLALGVVDINHVGVCGKVIANNRRDIWLETRLSLGMNPSILSEDSL